MSNRYDSLIAEKERLECKISQQKARLQLKRNSESNIKRKKRTRSLIQKGALLEKYFDVAHLSVDETESFLSHFSGYIKNEMPERFKRRNTPV